MPCCALLDWARGMLREIAYAATAPSRNMTAAWRRLPRCTRRSGRMTPEGADQREDHRRVERDRPEPVGLDHDQLLPSTSRVVAQIHERQITDVSTTSLGQCAPSATRAAQPSTSMIDGDRKDRPPAGRFAAQRGQHRDRAEGGAEKRDGGRRER